MSVSSDPVQTIGNYSQSQHQNQLFGCVERMRGENIVYCPNKQYGILSVRHPNKCKHCDTAIQSGKRDIHAHAHRQPDWMCQCPVQCKLVPPAIHTEASVCPAHSTPIILYTYAYNTYEIIFQISQHIMISNFVIGMEHSIIIIIKINSSIM